MVQEQHRRPQSGVRSNQGSRSGAPRTYAYSWLKAPRYEGRPYEVGPLARMWINGDYRNGISVMDRHLARAREALKIALAAHDWLEELVPEGPVYQPPTVPESASSMGLTEAPRGALGHWLGISEGRISHYQVISPTTWNASPRDNKGYPWPAGRGPARHARAECRAAHRGDASDSLVRSVPGLCGTRGEAEAQEQRTETGWLVMVRRQEHARAAIVGLGNVLLMDDGVGVHAIRCAKRAGPRRDHPRGGRHRPARRLELFESVDVVVAIDAVAAGGPPGSIYCLDVNDAQVPKHVSLHDLGIAAALRLLPVESRPRVLILGVEPAVIDYGTQLSPAVQAVLAQVTRAACAMADQLMHRADHGPTLQDFSPYDRQLELTVRRRDSLKSIFAWAAVLWLALARPRRGPALRRAGNWW